MGLDAGDEGHSDVNERGHQGKAQDALCLLICSAMHVHTLSVPGQGRGH